MHLFDEGKSKVNTMKPREDGLTMMMDKGLGLHAFRDCLELSARYIDFIKLGFGTLSLTPLSIVQQKLSLANQYQIAIYPGGTFFEWFAAEGKWEWYFQQISELGFSWVEISDGVIFLDGRQKKQMIRTAKDYGLQVITEIGKKEAGVTIPAAQLITKYQEDRANGAAYVIVEGRETGENIGIYNQKGELDVEYVMKVRQAGCCQHLIWEAPKKAQQAQLLRLWGQSVNLGNISSTDILSVEALRRGLRADTFEPKKE